MERQMVFVLTHTIKPGKRDRRYIGCLRRRSGNTRVEQGQRRGGHLGILKIS